MFETNYWGPIRVSDEEWVAMGGELSDEEQYNARFKGYFEIDL
ncbi:MAG TPA: hypothetical protein VIE41_07240 [Methylomirabilota bacterium]|jgi:hypothetical protein